MMSNDSPAQREPEAEVAGASRIEAFTFGEPAPVMKGELLDYVESWLNGKWYEPPLSWSGLAKSFHASPHHASALYVKRNVLASTFVPHKLLPWTSSPLVMLTLSGRAIAWAVRCSCGIRWPSTCGVVQSWTTIFLCRATGPSTNSNGGRCSTSLSLM